MSRGLAPARFPLVVAGPSGSGKTTVCRALVRRRPDLRFSVSATTRTARPGEREGEDYRFLTPGRFRELVERDGFLEWARVHDHLYGTPRSNLEEAVEAGAHLLLDIDVQGARQVREAVPETVSVFLLPPSGDRIVERLRDRGSEDEETLRARLAAAGEELAAIPGFDYAVVNDRLEETVGAVEAILSAEERRIARLGSEVRKRVETLTAEIRRCVADSAAASCPHHGSFGKEL